MVKSKKIILIIENVTNVYMCNFFGNFKGSCIGFYILILNIINNKNILFKFIKSIRATTDELNKKFIQRNNIDGAQNKLDFKNTLYASTQILKNQV